MPPRPRHPRSLLAVGAVAALTLALGACSNDDGDATTATSATTTTAGTTTQATTTTTEATTTTGGGTGGPAITTFEIETSVSCTRGGTFSAPAQWTTSANVESVDYTIDGEAPGAQAGLPTNGSGNLGPIPCDGQPHDVTFTAYADANSSTSVSRTVTGAPS